MGSLVFGLVVTIAVTLAVAVFILLFERRRAREIAADPERLPQRSRRSRKGNVRNRP